MANIYVGQMKDAVKSYYKRQQNFNAQIEENNKRYSPDYATKENAKIKDEQDKAYKEAEKNVNDVFLTVRGLLANANFVNVESLTADRMLFSNDSGFNLSVAEVQAFVERYSKNYTMLRLIADWIARNDIPTQDHPVGKYASVEIVLPVDILHAYKAFAEGALTLIDKIYNNDVVAIDGTASEIDSFGNELFASELFSIVGNGMELSDYKSMRVPETAKHAFDSVFIARANSNIYEPR